MKTQYNENSWIIHRSKVKRCLCCFKPDFSRKKKHSQKKGKRKQCLRSIPHIHYNTNMHSVHAPPFISPLLEHSTFRLHFSYVTIHPTVMDAQCTQCIFWSHIHSDNHCRSMAPIYRQFPGLSRKTLAQSWVRWMGGDVVQNRFHCVEEGGKNATTRSGNSLKILTLTAAPK